MVNIQFRFRKLLLFSTFIGVVIHEYAHKKFCNHYRIPVKEVCYFQLGNPPGYVVHAQPKSYIASFMISVAPAILNTTIGLVAGITLGYYFEIESGFSTVSNMSPVAILTALFISWIGISASVHNLPSKQDARAIWKQTKRNWYNPLIFIFSPVVLLIEIVNELRVVYADIITGLIVFFTGIYIGVNNELFLKILLQLYTHGDEEIQDLILIKILNVSFNFPY